MAYIPGLNLIPEVLLADGHTARTYTTPQGLSLWTHDLPILQGDKIKLDIFVATGGAELKKIKIRLDNAKVADLNAAPWNVTLETAKLAVGYHMIEVWGQGDGERPQSTTSTLSFYLISQMPVQYSVKGSQQILQGDYVANVPLEIQNQHPIDPEKALDPPAFLKNQTPDLAAQVVLHAVSTSGDGILLPQEAALTINQPTVFYASALSGGSAAYFAYALVRNGHTIIASQKPLSLNYQRIRLQSRTDDTPGLRSGPLTLYVWGVDKMGHPSAPSKTTLLIP